MEKATQYKRLYGLIGRTLGHSFSQSFFNKKFEAEHIDARYVNFELPTIDDLDRVLAARDNLAGLNVTIPYKEQVIARLDALDPEAVAIGAVNVIKIYRQPDGSLSLKGYNSDATGFRDSIAPMLKGGNHRRALVLGTGGASKAVIHTLGSLGIDCTLVSRTRREGVITYSDLTPEVMASHTVVINTTPLGMYPNINECPAIPYHLLTPAHVCYDLLYNPDTTLFMRRAAENGAKVKNGLEMLLLQAFIAWNIWNK